MPSDWEKLAQEKRDSLNARIPQEWKIGSIPSAEEQRDVTEYIRQFLSDREIEITETDAVGIVNQTTTGAWSAVEVVKAFCHRAALAHQLVGSGPPEAFVLRPCSIWKFESQTFRLQ